MRKVVVGRDDQRTEGDYENELDKDRGDQCLEVLTSSSVRVWSLVSNLRLNSTLSQSWQRELIRALANLAYTTYTCSTICPYLLIWCHYIIKRKEKEKKYKYWLRGIWQFITLSLSASTTDYLCLLGRESSPSQVPTALLTTALILGLHYHFSGKVPTLIVFLRMQRYSSACTSHNELAAQG